MINRANSSVVSSNACIAIPPPTRRAGPKAGHAVSVATPFGCRSGGELLAVRAERVDVGLDVALGVLHRDRPLLLIAGGHEDAPIDHPWVRGPVEVGHGLQEVPVVGQLG